MGHHLSVPPHDELVSTCHHWLALRSSRRTGPAETRLERGKVRVLAPGQRLGCPTRVLLPMDRRVMTDGERGT